MKTPFDSALRVQTRAMDAVRISLLAELAREHVVVAERNALRTAMRRESAVAAVDWQLTAHPYAQAQRGERARLDRSSQEIGHALEKLRRAAMDACSQMQAMTEAAARFSDGERQREARAEQVQADDFFGARNRSGRRPAACAG